MIYMHDNTLVETLGTIRRSRQMQGKSKRVERENMSNKESTGDSFLAFELKAKLRALGASVVDKDTKPFTPHSIFQNPVVQRTPSHSSSTKRSLDTRTTSAVVREYKLRAKASTPGPSASSASQSSTSLPPLHGQRGESVAKQQASAQRLGEPGRPTSSLSYFEAPSSGEPSDILRQLKNKRALSQAKLAACMFHFTCGVGY